MRFSFNQGAIIMTAAFALLVLGFTQHEPSYVPVPQPPTQVGVPVPGSKGTEVATITDDVEEIDNGNDNRPNEKPPTTLEELYNSGLNEKPRIILDPPTDFAGLIVKTASSYKRGDTLKVLVTNPTSDPLRYSDGPAGCTIHFERMVNGDWVRDFGVTDYDGSRAPCVVKELGASESVEFSRQINLDVEPGAYRVSFIMGQSDNYSNTFEIL